MLLRNGTLPEVWIPPRELRDQREMFRLRMCLVEARAQIKNRIHGVLMRYNVTLKAKDIYSGPGGRNWRSIVGVTALDQQSVVKQLQTVDYLQMQIEDCEQWLETAWRQCRARSVADAAGGGKILSAVIALEIGAVGVLPAHRT